MKQVIVLMLGFAKTKGEEEVSSFGSRRADASRAESYDQITTTPNPFCPYFTTTLQHPAVPSLLQM
jgi:hypothetical protein